MAIRERYDNGVFSWVDLSTTDRDAAKLFYRDLFDWVFEDIPMGDGPPYSMAFKNGRSIAALFLMSEDKREQNISPHWQSYINVENLEATVQAIQDYGGHIEFPPYDVLDAGRMAVVKDPTGAVVHLWQAKNHIGAGLVNEVNTFCWAELQTRGADQAIKFYQAVFDWEVDIEEKPPNYATCKVKGRFNCGIFDMDKTELPPSIPSHWAVYFNVENLDTSMDKVKALGGKVMMDPIAVDPGRFTTIVDPQGAVLTIMEVNQPGD